MSRSAIHHNSPLSTRASVNVRSNAIENNDDSVVTMREASTTTTTTGNRARSLSEFDLSLMPRGRIFPRTLHQWSVHHSLTTSNWIATISRPDPTDSQKMKYVQFPFSTEREARKFCNCFAPPKLCVGIQECMLCQQPKARHCRNCGASVCGRCSTRWGARMVPKTYMNIQSLTVSVCKSCDWLSNAFCMALLQGRFQDVQQIYQTGNVNLRTSFADIHREAIFPVHCAVMGGNLLTLQWLVETHLCPISVVSEQKNGFPKSLQTSASRTLIDLAMTGRPPKVDILVYLIHKGLSIHDVKNPLLIPKTLEFLLQSGLSNHRDFILPDVHTIDSSHDESVAAMEDLCILCCEKPMDCALVPCGHQVCCSDCGKQLTTCPFCKVSCSVLRIFRR